MGGVEDIVFLFSARQKLREIIGRTFQGDYITDYLSDIGAKTCVLENQYIDKDFTIDYQKFYSRSFRQIGKITKRIHFFSNEFSYEEFIGLLNDNAGGLTRSQLSESYLGFVVIRPIEDKDSNCLVGRTLLKTYPPTDGDKKRHYITDEYPASLFGIPLLIETLPFQAKDEGVSACATIALWTALHPLKNIFDISRYSPAEITERATSLPSFHRRFPTTGLTREQMINYIHSVGLDVEIIEPISEDQFQTAVKAYIYAGLPLLASLKMSPKPFNNETNEQIEDEEDTKKALRHAVVITGYQENNRGNINEIYVHDDVIGPYCRVKPDEDFFKAWKYGDYDYWTAKQYKVKFEDLRVPIYPKVRTTFWRIFNEYINIKRKMEDSPDLGHGTSELLLTSVQKYKELLLDNYIENKVNVLTKCLPKFLWVMRFYENELPQIDIVYDGTSIYPREKCKVVYSFE